MGYVYSLDRNPIGIVDATLSRSHSEPVFGHSDGVSSNRGSTNRGLTAAIGDSKHLRVLENAGLIARGREAQWRPRRLEAAPLKDVAEWAEEFRRFWDASFARLDPYLQQLKEQETSNDQPE